MNVMQQIMFGTNKSHFVENFRIAAGLSKGRHRGPGWNDGDTYKWIEALCVMIALQDGAVAKSDAIEQLNSAIESIVKAQREDGYLHTPVLIENRNGNWEKQPFGDPIQFEMYNFGHLMTAACVCLETTGDRRLLDVAIKVADFLDRRFADPDVQLARHAICPAHYMGIIDLYRVTRNERYLLLAKRLLDMREMVQGGDDNQDRIALRSQREAVGHAVRANYLYAGVCDLAIETQDASFREALESCWQSVQMRKIYVTGGCGALFDGASPDGSSAQSQITRIHQAYGRNYQLPNSTAHNETCAAIGYVLWNYRMWQLYGDAKYMDALENSLYNAVLAGVSLDGKRFFYTNTLRQLNQMPTELRWSRERQEWISCYCCPPNVARIIASVGKYAYSVSEDTVTLHLYGTNTINTVTKNGTHIHLSQVADYPSDGRIVLEVNAMPNRECALRFRVPSWCEKAELRFEQSIENVSNARGRYVEKRRIWKRGDRIELEFDMSPQILEAHPLVEECRGQVAIRRGPLIYCVESADLPSGTNMLDVRINPEVKFSVGPKLSGWGQVPTLRAGLQISASSEIDKSESLYKPRSQRSMNSIESSLIPYFAWGNRGRGEMSVWIPVSP